MQVSVKPEISYLDKLLKECCKGVSPTVPPEFPLDGKMASWLQQVRDRAGTWVRELAFPTKQDEEWRFSDLSAMMKLNFQAPAPVNLDALNITPFILPEATDSRLVFVNGVFAPKLSLVEGLTDRVFVGNLGQLPPEYQDRIGDYLGQQQGSKEVFTSLNTAGLTDAAVVWLPKNQVVEKPIHLLFIATQTEIPILTQRRCLVVAERNSSATIIEHCVTAEVICPEAPTSRPYLTNTVTEIWVEENAEINHSRVQRDAGTAFHIGKTAIAQAKNSRYTCNAIHLGAKLSRHNLEVSQMGEGTETNLYGLAFIGNEQEADTHSAIILNHPNGVTEQLYKCIVDDKAHSIFNGKVYVSQTAQLTNAAQLNRNLLLSSGGRVDTKPQLEIIADNVQCSHGATVSQLDDDEVFYLQSRGLNEEVSRNLLIDAFAAEIINKLPLPSLQNILKQCVACKV
ncbi:MULTISPECIES: Fe-S cluster assembly protein SufD [Okeania]|uniref:Fe-S cluster assembly protein SufD n=1 Tax=Okeania hirsuta TaxID=1458930 RepID=A0A3N6RK37_9CYAN|nr:MULTISPECIES: Fe-S cluster assembly protein SufD [Okeania]NET13685.1 Fe-S cluster assembly protein SufD [Okeania sp. SIO1H6]NES79337.1 Fe-S cluster assembly protein SufD [Okeania sp. SIO1H4]NES91573.1 Fe-S cluster assembly protein SufD [Okeania sp. SIO2B9]NET21078.1 Fe-S cluster assembly protein SufD [Okeania sp. SIO1H5]NET77815.1 Fe-S cluster assembly protein SufD [Okeania sp. SIO1F9]